MDWTMAADGILLEWEGTRMEGFNNVNIFASRYMLLKHTNKNDCNYANKCVQGASETFDDNELK